MDSGPPQSRFVILTTSANTAVSALHGRMPVILDAEEKDAWLDGSAADKIISRAGPALARATA